MDKLEESLLHFKRSTSLESQSRLSKNIGLLPVDTGEIIEEPSRALKCKHEFSCVECFNIHTYHF